ncbi:hypothetical protein K491DRAFT_579053, partial [Lophiostoma macrostomum CBS 122681]
GKCEEISHINTIAHVSINIIGTLLLGCSSLVMQMLSAPTREDIDAAHSKQSWLDIGVLSLRNVAFFGYARKACWLMLALSSLPLHLIGSWFDGDLFHNPNLTSEQPDVPNFVDPLRIQTALVHHMSQFERLEKNECIEAYAKQILSDRRNLVLVTSFSSYQDMMPDENARQAPDFLRHPQSRKALCSDGGYKQANTQREPWSVFGFEVDYCISEKPDEKCSIDVAISLLLTVIAFDLIRVTTMIVSMYCLQKEPLLTIGDAISSFILQKPDSLGFRCLSTRRDVQETRRKIRKVEYKAPSMAPRLFRQEEVRRFRACSKLRWAIASALTLMAVSAIMGLLGFAIATLKLYERGDLKSIWSIGLGKITPWNIITGNDAIVGMAMMVNLPQLLMSFLYILINGLLTSMSVADEWCQRSYRWRTLRVSGLTRTGQQRSSYFLQLPYRFGIPLMAFSALMHWMISQAFFLVTIITQPATGEMDAASNPGYTLTTCAFSPVAMTMAATGIIALFAFVVIIGLRELKQNGMPLVGSCSLAIAASCQVPPATSASLPLMWG